MTLYPPLCVEAAPFSLCQTGDTPSLACGGGQLLGAGDGSGQK